MLLVPLAVAVRGTFGPALLLLPLLVTLLFCFVLGCALIVAVLHAYFRDVAPVLTAALLPWFFLTPIFFQPDGLSFIDAHPWLATVLNWVNPIAPFIAAMRSVLYSGNAPGLGPPRLRAVRGRARAGARQRRVPRMEGDLAVVV